MASLILVDGMNIANRGTVATEIMSRFKKDEAEYYNCASQNLPHFYVRMIKDVLEKQKSVIIEGSWRDQYLIKSMGDEPKMHPAFTRMLDRIALGCDALIAQCYADTRTYAVNVAKIAPYEMMKDIIQKTQSAWDALDDRGLSTCKVFTGDVGYKADVDIIMERLQAMPRNAGPGIGTWRPGKSILIIGDRHGPSIQPYKVDTNLAFCDMAKAGASFWLSNQLEEAGIAEKHLYWINAYDQNDEPTDPEFVAHLRPPTIMVLGDNAARWCEAHRFRFESFSHPQYHKRFKHNEPYPLIDRLKEIVREIND